ncbi:hypothetical protein MNQ96_06160 [Sphingopyxis granuli]|uniref:hypothetical protein n=1 Tax=Sphingopyxis granuli TaxID=267128 RepID=UPI001F52D3B4|nr:hypothetical protein [Sphingopyxis granuli]UNK80656.1 hypothetical protein MNQ96_06160 [Sphingopyxis granuli]
MAKGLKEWAKANGRDFPWRLSSAGTYQQVIVEVLLQRTTATAVAGFFGAFVAKYPDWSQLAAAKVEDLEDFLKPFGLWRRRAKSLIGIASYAAQNDGRFPSDPGEHRHVPAVGQYVSNAILQFQHGRAAPLLDVNMARVIERFVRPRKLADIRHDPWLQEAAHWLVRRGSKEVNWAVLDFAALVCRARSPLCPACPVSAQCSYFNRSKVTRAIGPGGSPLKDSRQD